VKRPPVIGESGYSNEHYWYEEAPRCGLGAVNELTGQGVGLCRHPKEPGLPWCNRHTFLFEKQMRASGYTSDNARAALPAMGFNAKAIETFVARYEREEKT